MAKNIGKLNQEKTEQENYVERRWHRKRKEEKSESPKCVILKVDGEKKGW